MTATFSGCRKLVTLDLSMFNTNVCTTMSNMFNNCPALTTLNFSNANTSLVTTMATMFFGDSDLTTIDIRNFDSTSLTSTANMFGAVPKSAIVTIDPSKFTKTEADCSWSGTFTTI